MIGDSDLQNVIDRFEEYPYTEDGHTIDLSLLKTILTRLHHKNEYLQEQVDKLNEVFYDQLNEYDQIVATEEHQSDDTYGFHDYEQQYYNTLLDEDEQENYK